MALWEDVILTEYCTPLVFIPLVVHNYRTRDIWDEVQPCSQRAYRISSEMEPGGGEPRFPARMRLSLLSDYGVVIGFLFLLLTIVLQRRLTR